MSDDVITSGPEVSPLPSPRLVTLKVLIEGDANDRMAIAASLRTVARDIESGIPNCRCSCDEHGCSVDFDVTLGASLNLVNDLCCADPRWRESKIAWELKRKGDKDP